MLRNTKALAAMAALMLASSCADNADSDGDGKISKNERADEMAKDGYLSMKPGRWKTSFTFSEMDVPRLGRDEKAKALREAGEQSSGVSCLTPEQAAKPGADFFGGKGAEDCAYSKFDLAGNRVRMTLTCGMGGMGKVSMDLDGTAADTSFEYDTRLTMDVPLAGKIKMVGKMTGTHEGQCQGNE